MDIGSIANNILLKSLLYAAQFGVIGGGVWLLYQLKQSKSTSFLDNLHQTIEDRSCSTHIIGVQGSGKTYLAMEQFLSDIEKGYGALWMSTQGIDNSGLLDYIPADKIDKVILFRPYIDKPIGINLLKTYTNTQLEKSLIADSVVVLFKRLFDNFKDNMEGLLTASTLALLEYSDKTNKKVSLWDLYVFLSDESYRLEVISKVENIIALDMLSEINTDNKPLQSSLQALLRRFRKLLYHDHMVAFLSQKENDVDLLKAVRQRKIIICDFLAGGIGGNGIGKESSKFLAELMVSKFQLIAETRNINSSLYPLYLDEFQTYTSTSDNIKDFIDLNRQRRMPVILINQRRYQLPQALQDAVDSCGTKYILTLNPNDWQHYIKMYPQYEEEIPKLTHREFIADIRSYGKNYDFVSMSPDIRERVDLGYKIKRNNIGKYTTEEIIHNIKHKEDDNIGVDIFQ